MDSLYETKLFLEINEWIEQNQKNKLNKIEQTVKNSASYFFQKIPQEFTSTLNEFISSSFFHTQSLLQTSKQFQEKKDDLLDRASIFNNKINTIQDLKQLPLRQLNFLAEQEISKAIVISSFQGGISGTSSKLALACDLPGLFLLNLKSVQEIALCYGFDVSLPFEMECSLKVLQGALLPSPAKYNVWMNLMSNVVKLEEDEIVFANWDDDESFHNENFYQPFLYHIGKLYVLFALKKRLIGGVPLIGIVAGAKWNETLTKNLLDYTKKFYQFRLLSNRIKKEPTD